MDQDLHFGPIPQYSGMLHRFSDRHKRQTLRWFSSTTTAWEPDCVYGAEQLRSEKIGFVVNDEWSEQLFHFNELEVHIEEALIILTGLGHFIIAAFVMPIHKHILAGLSTGIQSFEDVVQVPR